MVERDNMRGKGCVVKALLAFSFLILLFAQALITASQTQPGSAQASILWQFDTKG